MRIVSAAFFMVLLFSVFSACNKEKSYEVAAPAGGSLRSETSGDCLPKTAVGAFVAGSAVTDSNYLEVEVDVSTAGAYNIHTDTLNGYSFSSIGNFSKAGINRIRLAASGTPVAAGENSFTVFFDTSICFVPVTVLPAGSNAGPATFTLQGSGDSCILASVAGDYVQGTPLSSTNIVSIKVNVTTPGTYTVSTNNVNEFGFSGSGMLAATGEQTIVLTATGTPATEGATMFTVTAGSTTCSFAVNVAPAGTPPPVTNGDLFPLTPNSYWTYDVSVPGSVSDTVLRQNAASGVINGTTYQAFVQTGLLENDTALYRKDGNNYYTFGPVDAYTQIVLDTPQYAEMIFLKEGMNVGDTWNSGEYTGTDNGKPVTFHYVYTCTSANASLSVNNNSFSNVYVVSQKVVGTLDGAPYVPEGGGDATETSYYYAKGIGLVQVISQLNTGITDLTIKIRNWSVK